MAFTPPPPGAAFANDEIDIRTIIGMLCRRRWLIVAALIVSTVVGAVITIRAPRIYRATARVLIEKHAPQVLSNVREVYNLGTQGYWESQEYYVTQYEIIKSRPVAQRVASLIGLDGKMLAEQIKALPPSSLESKMARDPLSDLPKALQDKLKFIGITSAKSRENLIEIAEEFNAVSFVRGRISVSEVKGTHLVDISISDTDPKRAAILANAVANAYIEINLDQKTDVTSSAVDWLSEQMLELKTKLYSSEMALHEFKKENNIVSVSLKDRQSMISQTLTALNQSLSTVQAQRIAIESRRAQLARARAAGAPTDAIAEVLTNPLIQQLKSSLVTLQQEEAELALKYTPEHPKLRAVHEKMKLVENDLNSEIEKSLRTIEDQYFTLKDNEQRLQKTIGQTKSEALELNKKEIDYNRLAREAENNLDLYQMVLKRQKEADLTQMLKVNNVKLHELATVPVYPFSPRVRVNMAMALFIGLLLGVGLAFLFDFMDSSVKTQDQVEQVLGLPFLGIIPAIKTDLSEKNGNSPKDIKNAPPSERDLYILDHPHSSVAECSRTIRTNLMFMSPDQPPQNLLITSSS
ncbi:GumC family protein, partial [Myxococcota bacterium]|nr:GumC family protein [Myxococcota bacterium]